MARIRYRTSVAIISPKKTNDAHIDSGAKHILFHSKEGFQNYLCLSEEVISASGTSRIVVIGEVLLSLHVGIYLEAYHVPTFAENIISVHVLSKTFDVLLATTDEGTSHCSVIVAGSSRVVFQTESKHGLYRMSISNEQRQVAFCSAQPEPDNSGHCLICTTVARSFDHNSFRPTPLVSPNKRKMKRKTSEG